MNKIKRSTNYILAEIGEGSICTPDSYIIRKDRDGRWIGVGVHNKNEKYQFMVSQLRDEEFIEILWQGERSNI